MRRCFRSLLTLLLSMALLLLCGVVYAGITQPSSGGGAAPKTVTISSGVLASGASANGDATDWFDLGSIFRVRFTSTASSCVDVQLFGRDTKLSADRVYYVYHADGQTATWYDRIGVGYADLDGTKELHWTVTNCGAASTTVSLVVDGVGK